MATRREFTPATQREALVRQGYRCASCGTPITNLGERGRPVHKFGEIAHAHHVEHAAEGGGREVENCVIICQACHYNAHEGGNYRFGTVGGRREDFPHFRAK